MSEATGFWAAEWYNQNSQRSYPFDDSADRMDDTETLEIPTDFLVDMVFAVHAGSYSNPDRFYVSSITIFPQGCVITVSYDGIPIASAHVPSVGFVPNSSYPLVGHGEFSDSCGTVVVGSLDNMNQLPPGTWSFDLESGRLTSAAVRPALRGVSALRVAAGADVSERIQGDVEIVAGLNIRFRTTVSGSTTIIYIDCIDGAGTVEQCECDNMPKDAPCIRTINGTAPNSEGNIDVLGSSCMALSAITSGLWFQDLCSEPCCGCDELEVVTKTLEGLATEITSLNSYAHKLDGNMTQLLQSVIASKLSDIPA